MAWTKVVTESSADNIAQTAAEAVILETGRTISTTGEVTVTTGAFNGSGNVTGAATITDDVVDEANLKISNSASDGMFLQYKDSTDQLTWASPTDISALANLTDATIDGTPADGEMLVYDTTNKWQNQTLAETGIQPLDADLTALASCQTGAATALALLTSTEVAILDGATATSTELNYLDITTLGTSEASKAVTADANGDVTIADGAYDFDIASHDGTNGLKLGGTLVTADAADLNYAKDLYDTGVTSTEFDYLDGVSSNIQTQLDAKQASGTYYTDTLNATYWQTNANRTIGNSGATLTIAGNLTVSGTTTTIDTTTLSVEDNVVTLNSNATTGGSTADVDAGIEVERGDQTNTSITWDEGKHYWTQHIQKNSGDDNDSATGMIPMVESGTGTSGDAHAVGNFYLNTTTDQLYVNVG